MNPDCAGKMEQGLEHKDTKGLICRSDTKRVVLDAGGAKCGKRKKIADVEDSGHHIQIQIQIQEEEDC